MARDDWRVRIELAEAGGAHRLLDRLGLDLGSEARELAKELEEHRLAVSHDEDSVFAYAASRREAERAAAVVEAELRELGIAARELVVEHWLDEEDRWDDDVPGADVDDEVLARGYAPWEVRIPCDSVGEARELAARLEAEGYGVVRRFRYVIAGVDSQERAAELAGRYQGRVEPGGELVWEVTPANPFAIFLGGIGG
ncbi:MAG TPA: hypothetical protein VFI37_02055 [Gaiellaceae bacterium]|jgi:hypothetical protein|nr:hypothetical protein [Gaiellaceae bacterium]